MSFSSVAGDASAKWYDAADEMSVPTAAHSALRRILGWVLSDKAIVGVAFQHDQPVVVAVDGSRLICVRHEDPSVQGAEAVIALDSVPLDVQLRVGLVVAQQMHGNRPFLVRKWTIGEPNGSPLKVETRTPINDWQASEYGGRKVIELAVATLGWPLGEGQ
jgi:hypothetical protein